MCACITDVAAPPDARGRRGAAIFNINQNQTDLKMQPPFMSPSTRSQTAARRHRHQLQAAPPRFSSMTQAAYKYLTAMADLGNDQLSVPAMVIPVLLGMPADTNSDFVRHFTDYGTEGVDWSFKHGATPFLTPRFARLLMIQSPEEVGSQLLEIYTTLPDAFFRSSRIDSAVAAVIGVRPDYFMNI